MENYDFSRQGQLTLVSTPGFEAIAESLKKPIEEIGKMEKIDLVHPEYSLRASGEPVIRQGKDHVGGHDCMILTSGPGTYEMLGQLQFILGILKGHRASRIGILSGYLPLARSDKDEPDKNELSVASHVIHMLKNAAYGKLDRIITFDFHCPQNTMAGGEMGLITEVSVIRRVLKRAIDEALKITNKICIVFPDEGARKRFEGDLNVICDKMNLRMARVFGSKTREDSHTSNLLGLHGDLDALPESIAITVDDEIATAKTNIETAEKLKEMKEYNVKQVWAAVVHGVLCEKALERLSKANCALDKIFVSDSIPFTNRPQFKSLMDSERMQVIFLNDDRAHIIYYNHHDINIRDRRG